ncbi:MAG: CBS domain-containing protein [Phycisphaerae bacterium]|nr:CBS domain-containing protein [Phycisphaerae bacterium]
MMDERMALWTAVLAALGSGVFSAIAYSLWYVNRVKVEDLARQRGRAARAAAIGAMLDEAGGHARALLLVRVVLDFVTLAGLVSWAAAVTGSEPLGWRSLLLGLGVGSGLLWFTSVWVAAGAAEHAGDRLLYWFAGLVRAVYALTSPLRPVGLFVGEVVRRLLGAPLKDEAEAIEDELLSVVEEGEREGTIDEQGREMIEGVMRFGALSVSQIMTPRTDVEALEHTDNLGEVTRTIRRIGHSRIPVYEGSLDHVTGIFYVKDLMKWLAGDGQHSGKPFELRSVLRPALFVPETKTVRELLDEMIQKKVHIAMVADEYGGTSGLVTIEDIVEQIVGDIKDEYEPGAVEGPGIVVGEGRREAVVEGSTRIAEANDALAELGLDIPESDEYDTVGGFVVTTLGRIPAAGEAFAHERLALTILEAKPTKVVKVRIERVPDGAAGEPAVNGTRGTGAVDAADEPVTNGARPGAGDRQGARAG